MTQRRRVSVTIDPVLLNEVDAFVERHPEVDRSKVFDEALALWYAARQDEAMTAQFCQDPDARERAAIAAWRDVQAAAASRVLRHDWRG